MPLSSRQSSTFPSQSICVSLSLWFTAATVAQIVRTRLRSIFYIYSPYVYVRFVSDTQLLTHSVDDAHVHHFTSCFHARASMSMETTLQWLFHVKSWRCQWWWRLSAAMLCADKYFIHKYSKSIRWLCVCDRTTCDNMWSCVPVYTQWYFISTTTSTTTYYVWALMYRVPKTIVYIIPFRSVTIIYSNTRAHCTRIVFFFFGFSSHHLGHKVKLCVRNKYSDSR